LDNRGVMNHWTRLFLMLVLLGTDGFLYTMSPSDTVSYSAHMGGLLMGFFMGVCVLDTLETTEWHRWAGKPLAFTAAMMLPGCMALYYYGNWQAGEFPPHAAKTFLGLAKRENCCAQLLHCPGVDPAAYDDAFYCPVPGLELYKNSGAGKILVQGCDALEAVAVTFA
jgi:hypothetical protein